MSFSKIVPSRRNPPIAIEGTYVSIERIEVYKKAADQINAAVGIDDYVQIIPVESDTLIMSDGEMIRTRITGSWLHQPAQDLSTFWRTVDAIDLQLQQQ